MVRPSRPLRFHCRGLGKIPGRGTKTPQAVWQKEGKKKKKKEKEEEILQGTRPFGSESDPLGTSGISHKSLL